MAYLKCISWHINLFVITSLEEIVFSDNFDSCCTKFFFDDIIYYYLFNKLLTNQSMFSLVCMFLCLLCVLTYSANDKLIWLFFFNRKWR